ncbi:proline-rich receptor-like protein kinase PERK9 [Iris pallida]|uniref:Proline-rich receptor-like protein kinase PERK9 n=1 Tax=Iris pallida TaxID=29817 RepID=A0AAX6EAC1_IRIPA|nr:proline-rich receptor-like protein kinase PERK9 [Iris pallida]KAJ6800988.1 proline-rich receptor-like protein kinase PERK9 [Iris pallida]
MANSGLPPPTLSPKLQHYYRHQQPYPSQTPSSRPPIRSNHTRTTTTSRAPPSCANSITSTPIPKPDHIISATTESSHHHCHPHRKPNRKKNLTLTGSPELFIALHGETAPRRLASPISSGTVALSRPCGSPPTFVRDLSGSLLA